MGRWGVRGIEKVALKEDVNCSSEGTGYLGWDGEWKSVWEEISLRIFIPDVSRSRVANFGKLEGGFYFLIH